MRAHTPKLWRVRYGSTRIWFVISFEHYIETVPTANSFSPSLLSPALNAARTALARMDDDEIPPRVRAVARKSGNLPAPLARSLIAELDRNPWLRQQAKDHGEDLDADDPHPPRAASAEFLTREDGWEERFNALAEANLEKSENSRRSRLVEELRKAESQNESLRRRLDNLERSPVDRERNSTTKPVDTGAMAEIQRLKGAAAQLGKGLDQALGDVALLSAHNEELTERVEDLLRRRRSKAVPQAATPTGLRRGAIELARELDARMQALSLPPRAQTAHRAQEETDDHDQVRFPPGIRPDIAEAIDWLLSCRGPLTVAVDGWNLAFQFKNPPGRRERRQVEAAVGRLSTRSRGERRLIVLFDSRFDLASVQSGTHPQVEVVFPASADEALIDMASKVSPLVVISSDRRVREEAGRSGAIGLWGEAVIDWLNQPRP